MVSMPKKQSFLDRLLSYWILKRQSRNGVPLLRRLQTSQTSRRDPDLDKDAASLGEQLQYWQKLRQDLERARLLVELIRKREKLKREYIRAHQLATEMQIQPLIVKLRQVIEQLREKDIGEIFAKPVDLNEVPDYLEYIKQPMDLSTMLTKVDSYQYETFDSFENDFSLMIKNCLSYNSKDTVFYKAALKMREQGGHVLREARKYVAVSFNFKTGLFLEQKVQTKHETHSSGSEENKSEQRSTPERQLDRVLNKLDEAYKEKPGVSRTKKIKRLRTESVILRRKISLRAAIERKRSRDISGFKLHSNDAKPKVLEETPLKNISQSPSKIKQEDNSKSLISDIKGASSSRLKSETEVKVVKKRGRPKESGSFKLLKGQTDIRSFTRNRGKANENVDSKLSNTDTDVSTKASPNKTKTRQKSQDSSSEMEETSFSNVKGKPAEDSIVRDKKVVRTPLRRAAKEGVNQSMIFTDTDEDDKCSVDLPVKTSPPKAIFHGRNLRNQGNDSTEEEIEVPRPRVGRPPRKSFKNKSPSSSSVKPGKGLAVPESQITTLKAAKSPVASEVQKSVKGSSPVLKPHAPEVKSDSSAIMHHKRFQKHESAITGRTRRSMTTRRESVKDFSSEASEAETDKSYDMKERETRSKVVRAQGRSQSETDIIPVKKSLKKVRTSSMTTEGEVSTRRKSSALNSGSLSTCLTSFSSLPQTDSFKVYRSNTKDHGTDSDNNSLKNSSSEEEEEEEESEYETAEENEDDDAKDSQNAGTAISARTQELQEIELQPLDLVWAKCRGYPWYPALIISPDMPNSGYFHNGVPIPIPPDDVLALKANYKSNVYLVLFFDTKRTWQWLPRDKLEPLGVDSNLDKARLVESKKAAERKAVKKAFENAILHRCRVTGESTSISNESDNES